MNLSELIFSLLFIGLLSLPVLMSETEQHDHRTHYVPMNNVKGTTITVCIADGDTVSQVAFPNSHMRKHIPYD